MTTALSQLSKYHKSALQLQLLQSKHRALKGASSTLGPSAGFSCARYATAIPKYSDPHGCQPPADISSGSILTANLRHTHKSTLPSSCSLLSSQWSTEETTLISRKLIQMGINKTGLNINFIKSFCFNICLDSPYCKLEAKLSASSVNTALLELSSWKHPDSLLEGKIKDHNKDTPVWTLAILTCPWPSQRKSDAALFYYGYTREKTASVLAGNSLQSILCAFIQRFQAHALLPPSHIQTGWWMIYSRYPTEWHHTLLLAAIRAVYISEEVLLQQLHGWQPPSHPWQSLPPPPHRDRSGAEPTPELKSLLFPWYLNSGHHQSWWQ